MVDTPPGIDPKPYYTSAFAIGIVAAAVMTLLEWMARLAGITELNLSMILGTSTVFAFGPSPGAWVQGFIAMLVMGGLFALVYAWIFEAWPAHTARAWLGAAIGAAHAIVGGALLAWLVPPLHPGAGEFPLLANPGFMAGNYGSPTVAVFVILHIIFGAIIGGWMHFAPLATRYLAAVTDRAHHRGSAGAPPISPAAPRH